MTNRIAGQGNRVNALWSNEELQAAVDSYVYLLRLQQNGVICSESMTAPLLTWGPLINRNAASIRYRMRNISAVMQELGAPTLSIYSPADQVGAGVRKRLQRMLLAHPFFESLRHELHAPPEARSAMGRGSDRIYAALHELRDRIEALEAGMGGIGHNNPPEPIEPMFGRDNLLQVKEDIYRLEAELQERANDATVRRSWFDSMVWFGLKLSVWLGQRLTKFVDAALVTAAPILVAKATDVLPSLIDVVRSISHLVVR